MPTLCRNRLKKLAGGIRGTLISKIYKIVKRFCVEGACEKKQNVQNCVPTLCRNRHKKLAGGIRGSLIPKIYQAVKRFCFEGASGNNKMCEIVCQLLVEIVLKN